MNFFFYLGIKGTFEKNVSLTHSKNLIHAELDTVDKVNFVVNKEPTTTIVESIAADGIVVLY